MYVLPKKLPEAISDIMIDEKVLKPLIVNAFLEL